MIASTSDELEALLRKDLDDELPEGDTDDSDRLWKTDEVYTYLTLGFDRWAKDTDGLYKVLSLDVVEGEDVVKVPRYVLDIRSAKLVDQDVFVETNNHNESSSTGFYRDDYGRVGRGHRLVRDYYRNAIVLSPVPTQDDTLEIQCTVTLTTPMQCGQMLPTLDAEDQDLVLMYAKYRAYMKQDVETRDSRRAAEYKALYDAGVKARKTALQRYRRVPGAVRMSNW